MERFLTVVFIALLFSGCFKPKEVIPVNKVALKKINYAIDTKYEYTESKATVKVYLLTENDEVVRLSDKDSLLISGIPMTFNNNAYVGVVPTASHKFDLYLKLKDTLCFQQSMTLPYISFFKNTFRDSLRFIYAPSLHSNESIHMFVGNTKTTVEEYYPLARKGQQNYGTYVQKDTLDEISLPSSSLKRQIANAPFSLTLEKTASGTSKMHDYELEYNFTVYLKQDFR